MEKILDKIFSESPRPPCTYNLNLCNDNEGTLFQLLMGVLIYGAKKMFGDDITPSKITGEQFSTLKAYMESMGYIIKYDFTDLSQTGFTPLNPNKPPPKIINIWFEQYIQRIDCHGRPAMKLF